MSSQEFEDEVDDDASNAEESYSDTDSTEAGYIASEEKKPLSKATVVLFALFGAAGLFSYFYFVKHGPQAIAADSDPNGEVINQFISDKNRNFLTMQKMLRDTDAVVRQFLTYPSVTQIPLTDLHTNPFRAIVAPVQGAAPSARDEEKEKKQRREEERQAVILAVHNLQLQSVMHSDKSKSCMINNSLYREGEQVDGFTIEKISPNAVIVRQSVFKFQLKMQR